MNYYRVRFTLANGKKAYVRVLAQHIETARTIARDELERLPGSAIVEVHVTALRAYTKAQTGRWTNPRNERD